MKNLLVAITLFTGTVTALAFYPEASITPNPPVPPPVPARPVVEVAFVLDTTGSMGGMIATAKDKIWSIASTLAKGQPTPEIRVGLVAFRDRGDAYVTRVHDLTSDLDRMYVELMALQAAGGGDGPEAVATALADAVDGLSWTRQEHVYRAIFLVGDAPAHTGREGEPRLDQLLLQAGERGIVVNTVQCGDDAITHAHWNRIAQWGSGNYLQVDQSGSGLHLQTPYDQRLAQAARELDETRLFYGDADARQRARRKHEDAAILAARAPTAAQARRAIFNSSAGGAVNFAGDDELVEALTSGRVELDSLPPEQLPESLRSLPPAARMEAVNGAADRRSSLMNEIRDLSERRSAYINDRIEPEGAATEQSLDQQVFTTVRQQAAQKGISYEEAEVDY